MVVVEYQLDKIDDDILDYHFVYFSGFSDIPGFL